MKSYKSTCLLFSCLTLFGWGCGLFSQSKIIFNNDSNVKIDSVIFHINSSTFISYNVGVKSQKQILINSDSVKLNNHDVVVRAEIFAYGNLFRGASFYNDLSGSLSNCYILNLKSDSTTTLFPE
jgi:hypothetical protein